MGEVGEGEKGGLSDVQASVLLDLLRDCTNAPPNRGNPDCFLDHNYYHAQLKRSDVWRSNDNVGRWLNGKWLCCLEVSIYAV